MREYTRKRYKTDDAFRAARRAASKRLDRSRRARLNGIKVRAGCLDCGYREHPAALDFDHRPGTLKKFQIGKSQLSWERVLVEIAKCDVRCANCHRIRTQERRHA